MAGGDVTVGLVAEQLSGDHSEEGEKAIGQAAGAVQDTPGLDGEVTFMQNKCSDKSMEV